MNNLLHEKDQYRYLIERCGVIKFDNLGLIHAKGEDVLDLIDRLSTNDVSKLQDNSWFDTVLTTNKGRIVAQIRLIKSSKQILIVSDRSVLTKIIEWIEFYTFSEDVEFEDVSESVSIYSVIGPKAHNAVRQGCRLPPFFYDDDHQPIIGSSVSYEQYGKDLILNVDRIGDLPKIDIILDREFRNGNDYKVASIMNKEVSPEVSPNVYNVIRIESRIPVHGLELTDKYNPLEANLLHNVSFNKGCYVGQEVVARLNSYDKVRMQLVLLYLDKNCKPTPDMLVTSGSNEVGVLTSVEFSHYADKWTVLAYIKKSQCVPQNEFFVGGEEANFKCEIGDFGLTN